MSPQFAPVMGLTEASCQVGSPASVLAAHAPDLALFVGHLVNPDSLHFQVG